MKIKNPLRILNKTVTNIINNIFDKPVLHSASILIFVFTLVIVANLFNKKFSSVLQTSKDNNSFSTYFLTVFEGTKAIQEELGYLEEDLLSKNVLFYIYTPDLNYRIRVGGTGASAFTDDQLILVAIDEVYQQQLEDHIYNRCSYFDVLNLPESRYKELSVEAKLNHVFSCPVYDINGLIGYVAVAYNSLELPMNKEIISDKLRFSINSIQNLVRLENLQASNFNKQELFIPPTSTEFREEIVKDSQEFFNKKNINNFVASVYYFNPSKTNFISLMRLDNNNKIPGFIPGEEVFQITTPSLRRVVRTVKNKKCYYLKVEDETSFENGINNDIYKLYLKSYNLNHVVICPIIKGNGEIIGMSEIGFVKNKQPILVKDFINLTKEYTNLVRDRVYLYLYLN